ncbi:efflux RND transporter periplasmic adaptor subunit [Pedobacter sp. SD-b]|uniref:Efflux RND transporter periplasmic adaptor subunit n=1 Tax=Pedobacter segetis TaxID=2793069 RepID=A0ABS1BI35_9SPHI|nr:efflux RND transporter periplasmic adaptor subunit [Pedobacter segetis]MBK0382525.1 efflux RND transporter periplasmic adaptor subunit [Pedobacter segetis]
MKKLKYLSLFLLLFCFGVLFISCSSKGDKKTEKALVEAKYTCPMHPQIVEDHPGSCPICNMDLVKITQQKSNNNGLTLNDRQIELANVKTISVGNGNFNHSKLLNARIVTNPNKIQVISSKFSGRIDRLYFKEAGQKIEKGQALFQIYSEDLLSLQKDYLLNLKQENAFPSEPIYKKLTEAAKNKLSLYGYSTWQIKQLSTANKTDPYITVYAPDTGLITEMTITEGQYITEGMGLMTIENLSNLWLEADVYPSEIKDLKTGTSIQIEVSGFANAPIQSKIDFINPQLNANSQILTIRANLPNLKGDFQPGMQAQVKFPSANKSAIISVPNDAVIRDEKGNYVWIETGKHRFAVRMVEIGDESEASTIIKSGIKIGDNVVVSGAYLLTSEFVLKKGGNMMSGMNM